MIEARNLSKRRGSELAVDGLSFDVRPGAVTGLLGAPGAGKSTAIRLMLGLDSGAGRTTFNGLEYRRLRNPLREVGVVADGSEFHPGRRAEAHLFMMAGAAGVGRERVDEVLEWVGLTAVSRRRIRTYSAGMRARLALATALLGDPAVLILDEPTRDLDSAASRWLRGFLRAFAAQGRTVLISGTDLAELTAVADHLIVLENGLITADEPAAAYTARMAASECVLARTPHVERLRRLLADHGASVVRAEDQQLAVAGLDRATVGDLAFRNGIVLHELRCGVADFETPFGDLGGRTDGAVGGAGTDGDSFIPNQAPPVRWRRARHAALANEETGPIDMTPELAGDDTQTFDIEAILAGRGR
ncbi:MAG: ABC transporter ATP-binding protein [Sporichthyaceae bacterium]